MKKLLKKIIRWALSDEIAQLNKLTRELDFLGTDTKVKLENLTHEVSKINDLIDVSASIERGSRHGSWAVISIEGRDNDFIRFVDLGNSELCEIQRFLSQFDKKNIDAHPADRRFLRDLKFRSRNKNFFI